MIKSGRNKREDTSNITSSPRGARLTAILGVLVFTVFLCSSVSGDKNTAKPTSSFGEGAYQVFAPVSATVGTANGDEKTVIAAEDGNLWSYLESVIARLIYGE